VLIGDRSPYQPFESFVFLIKKEKLWTNYNREYHTKLISKELYAIDMKKMGES
jgi:hypothetical protein